MGHCHLELYTRARCNFQLTQVKQLNLNLHKKNEIFLHKLRVIYIPIVCNDADYSQVKGKWKFSSLNDKNGGCSLS